MTVNSPSSTLDAIRSRRYRQKKRERDSADVVIPVRLTTGAISALRKMGALTVEYPTAKDFEEAVLSVFLQAYRDWEAKAGGDSDV